MKTVYILVACTVLSTACNNESKTSKQSADSADAAQHAIIDSANVELPAPFATKSVRNQSNVIGWKEGQKPVAPQGFTVSVFADKLESPRWIYAAENGDVFVAQADREGKKGNNILLFRDNNKDGIPESKSIYLSNEGTISILVRKHIALIKYKAKR